MNKIDEIIESGYELYDRSMVQIKTLPEMMKGYAEWYAEQFRQKILDECWIDDYGYETINSQSIKEIKLPEHE